MDEKSKIHCTVIDSISGDIVATTDPSKKKYIVADDLEEDSRCFVYSKKDWKHFNTLKKLNKVCNKGIKKLLKESE